jgi:dihydrofolate reductase
VRLNPAIQSLNYLLHLKLAAMRKLIMKMSVSLDGFVADENGKSDWVFKTGDPDSKAWSLRVTQEAGMIIMGRKSFESMAPYWQTSTDPFSVPMNSIPKGVFTKKGFKGLAPAADATAAAASWANARIFNTELAAGISELKAQDGKPILAIGGAGFMRSLIAEGLIDELNLAIHPVALGSGLPIFSGLESPAFLRLIDVKVFPGGTVVHIYGR